LALIKESSNAHDEGHLQIKLVEIVV